MSSEPLPSPPARSASARAGASRALQILSAVFAALDTLAIGWWSLLAVGYAPSFTSMFEAFGGELPLVTRLVIHPAFGPAMVLAATAAMAGAWRLPPSPDRRAAWLGGLFVVNALGISAVIFALFLPMFATFRNLDP